ncbi:hypothetical protein [Jeotgalibacillus malaysiensis]|uniref:hypothetical protein n=1 Tax=Jeotgalibacillus malaysiensis TaxID=1508404 RepID=UPI00384C6B5D
MSKIKVKNNAGKVVEVTKVAYETLYKNREGFELYKPEAKKVANTSAKKPTTAAKKKVAKG